MGRARLANDDRRAPKLTGQIASELVTGRSSQMIRGRRQFLRNKRQEWEEYRSEVTAFELRKNLPVL